MTTKIKSDDVDYKLRKCMCCQHQFLSEGIHNRLCEKCKNDDGDADFSAFSGMSVGSYFGHMNRGTVENPFDY